LGQLVVGDGDDRAGPPSCLGSAPHPFPLGEGSGFADVVDAACGPLAESSQGDCRGDILHVAPRPPPSGPLRTKENGWPPIVHALKVLESAMAVSGAVDGR